jgi:hypothetical protein
MLSEINDVEILKNIQQWCDEEKYYYFVLQFGSSTCGESRA